MKRVMQLSLLSMLLIAVTSTASIAAPLLIFQVNSVDTTADTLLSHAVLAHGYLDASPVPLAAGLYEFEAHIYSEADGGQLLWNTVVPIEVLSGGLLNTTIYNIPGKVFYERENNQLVMKKLFLQLSLPSLNKKYPRFPISSPPNAMSATRIFQFRLFHTWADEPTTTLPPEVSQEMLDFIKDKQEKEVINDLVEELVKQKVQMQQMQGIIDELKKKAGKL